MIAMFWLGGISPAAGAQTGVIAFDLVHVRSGPGISYEVVGSLNNNTNITVLEHNKGWIKISSGDLTGWVPETLTDLSPSSAYIPHLQIYFNGKPAYDLDPVSINGCTLVPLAALLNTIGATVTIDSDTQTIIAQKFGTTIKLTVGAQDAVVNDQVKSLDVPVTIVNGRTFVPLRFLAETWELKTTWDGENRKIYVECPQPNVLNSNYSTDLAIIISASDVNLRSGPSTSAAIVGLVPYGTLLVYTGDQDGWYQVRYRGQSAWVAGWLATGPVTAQVPDDAVPTLLPVPSTHYGFVVQMKPYAETVSQGTGLPVNFLLAQWAEESGFGTSTLAQYYNNFGGIKDPDTGGFKKYQTADEFAQDIINIYTGNSNYRKLLADAKAGASIQALLNDLNACHYASSSSYGQKIKNVYLPEIDAALASI
jgi:Muramidase (flagellum-specific)